MKGHRVAPLLPPILAALAIVALTLYAYRILPARPFAADDYQWLLNVRGMSFGEVARTAFDPSAQSHFYRPLVWLLFWAQTRVFGLDPRGFHAVSLALHLLNAFLLGWLFYRLTGDERRRTKDETRYSWSFAFRLPTALVVGAIVALHPAPFEAVVWISAQSELLAAALLLLALHLWLCRRRTQEEADANPWSLVIGRWSILATFFLGLALLAKESAVIGLPLLMLLGRGLKNQERAPTGFIENPESVSHEPRSTAVEQFSRFNTQFSILNVVPYILPTLLTLAYVALQIIIERRNYLLEQGDYGLGRQIVLNPLRSLALLVAPRPGTEHADAAWLVPLGTLVAVGLLGFWILDFSIRMRSRREPSAICHLPSAIILALALTLLPTAPFASPPDSRYLYLPVVAGALLVGVISNELRVTRYQKHSWSLVTGMLVLTLAWWASGELHARERRFAAASGPGGSLWQAATWACAASRPERTIVVEPPVAAPHVEAIIELACGPEVRATIVGRNQVEGALKGRTLVIGFPNGSAEVQRWP